MREGKVFFEVFRYQILPKNRHLQGDFIGDFSSVEELISKKNKFFRESLIWDKNIVFEKSRTRIRKIFDCEDFYLFKANRKKKIYRETSDFKRDVVDNWPSLYVAIWNEDDKQIIAVQKRSSAFSSNTSLLKIFQKVVNRYLSAYQLRMVFEPLFETYKFWKMVESNKNKIKSLEFDLVTPNMANISGSLSDDLKFFFKSTNSTNSSLEIKSDPDSSLFLDENNDMLRGLVDYSGEGGGRVSMRIKGARGKITTGDSVKEVGIDAIDLEGSSEDLAEILKGILS